MSGSQALKIGSRTAWTLGVLVLLAQPLVPARSPRLNARHQLIAHEARSLLEAVERYQVEYGAYPRTDQSGTWLDKVYEIEWPASLKRRGSLHEGEFEFRPPDEAVGRGRLTTMRGVVYSIGDNGRDEYGRGDDIDGSTGVPWGRYGTAYRPVALGVLGVVVAIVGFTVFACVRERVRRRDTATAVLAECLSGTILFTWLWSLNSGWRVDGDLSFLQPPAVAGLLLLAAWRLGVAGVEAAARRPSEVRPNCPTCGYDLTGLTMSVCPECGQRWSGG